MEAVLTTQKVVKIALFEDCMPVADAFFELFNTTERKVQVKLWTRVSIHTMNEVVGFSPDLIVTNLMLKADKEDGYALIGNLLNVIPAVPIVVWSKHISDSGSGQKETQRCLKAGAVAAFGKIPKYPSATDFLQFVR